MSLEKRDERFGLIRPRLNLEAAFLEMVEEFRRANDPWFDRDHSLRDNDFGAYVHWLKKGEIGVDLPDGYVPWTALWLWDYNTSALLGITSLRHRLTPALERCGGHIGYAIRPSQRGRGYGSVVLSLTLQEAAKLGLSQVHVHCEVQNVASERIIEKNGGVLRDETEPLAGTHIFRYLIELPHADEQRDVQNRY
jgi:predicted acetyltransferase